MLLFNSMAGFSQVFDHRHAYIGDIPIEIIDSIKQNKRFQWCGQSHSHQIPSGMKLLEQDYPYLDVTIGDGTSGYSTGGFLPEPNGTFCMMDGIQLYFSGICGKCCLHIVPHAYWDGQDAWQSVYKTFVTCFPEINISGFAWCGELSDYPAEYFQSYFDTLATYEEIYPNIQFIYTTGHSQYSGENGYNRHQRNEQIRQYCIDNNKLLFDFGDLDCWSNGEFSYYLFDGDTIPVQHSDYDGDTYHHTNALSCKNKAKAMWYMMAVLEGWNPNGFNYELWKQEVGNPIENSPPDYNGDGQVENRDKNMWYELKKKN